MRRPFVALGFLLLLGACGADDDDTIDPGPDAGVDPGPGYEEADWLFEADRLLDVEIELAEADWDTVRFQTRNILQIFGPDCGNAPTTSPFTYVEASVTVDGERVENVGVRKKGFLGSLDEVKPSLKIKFDEYIEGQKLTGTSRMTLNNSRQDPSFVNQCLGYAMFNAAGVPAPRCNFARVSINGRPMGIYVHVESVKKPFLGLHFDDNDGNLYEGTLSDFRAGWTSTFERKTNKSDPPGSEDRTDIQEIIDALAKNDTDMLADLESLIDIERFFSFWAVETMTSHGDGYSGNNNNFFIYDDPTTGKMSFLPWGADNLFANTSTTHDPAATRSVLTNRLFLHAPSRQRYLDRYEEILDTVWDDASLLAEIDRIELLIASSVTAERAQAFTDGLEARRSAIRGRELILRNEHAASDLSDAEAVSDPLCFTDVGPADSDLTASYNQGAATSATMSLTINGQPRVLSNVGAFIGRDENKADSTVMFMTAVDQNNKDMVVFLSMPNNQVGPGTVAVGEGLVEAVLFFTPQGGTEADEIYFMSGSLIMTNASTVTGSPWQAALDLRVWKTPFF